MHGPSSRNGVATLARATSIAEIFGARHYWAIAGAVALGANGARAAGRVGASRLWGVLGSFPSGFWGLAATLWPCGSLAQGQCRRLARREQFSQ
jgi:hypothetical protein